MQKLREDYDTIQIVPRIAMNTLRHGLMPIGWESFVLARKEGFRDFPDKVMGDALLRSGTWR